MPTPNDSESEPDFVGRCMETEIMVKDYPNQKQRVAVCHSQFEESTSQSFSTFCFSTEAGMVDREAGTIMDVSILSAGEAKGHGMMISQKTLESSITLLLNKSLPAYLSHSGASGDRLLTEAGYFSGFYRDKDKIRASKFTALESFKKYEPEKFDRLFEIAEVAPHSFGVSIVFEGQLFWEMSDGSELPMDVGFDVPENARFDVPTVRPLTITSADFVDMPAANGALFAAKVDSQHISKDMNSEIELGEPSNESASAHHTSDEEKFPPSVPPLDPEQPKPKKKAKKKALAEQDEDDRDDEERGEEDEIAKEDQGDQVADEEDAAEDRDDDEEPEADELEEPDNEYQEKMRAAVEEVYSHVENAVRRLKEVMDMVGVPDRAEGGEMSEVAELKALLGKKEARVLELTKLHTGTEPIKEKQGDSFQSVKDAKKCLIEKYLEVNPMQNRSSAVLAIAKTNPELFHQNN